MARSRKQRQVARAQARLPGGSIADNLDPEFNDDLEEDGLPDFLEAADELTAQVIDELIVKAKPVHAHVLRLKQTLPQGTLDTVRDLFLEGADVDAISILATELGMVPIGMVTDEIHLHTHEHTIYVRVSDMRGGWRDLIKSHGADVDSTVDHFAKVRDFTSYSSKVIEEESRG